MTIEVIQNPADVIAPTSMEPMWTSFKRQFLRQTTASIQYGDGEPVTVAAGRTACDVFIDLPRALSPEEFYGLLQEIDDYVTGLGLGNVKIGTPSQFNAPVGTGADFYKKQGTFGWVPCKETEPKSFLETLRETLSNEPNGTNHPAT